jgi:hypothetical protein
MVDVVYRRNNCRICESQDLELFLSLSPSPIGDAFVTFEEINVAQPSYPIDLYMCKHCGLGQLIDVVDPVVLYGEYIYVTASSTDLAAHFQAYAEDVIKRCRLDPGSLVLDIGSNDGTLLRGFQQQHMNVLGVEPAVHIAAQANSSGIVTINKFFSFDLAKTMVEEHGRAKLITANNVFANIDDLMSWVNGINTLLADEGIFVFESYYLADVVQNMVFDFIYHEHLSSFSVKPILVLFRRVGLELVAVERVHTKGGSLRYFVQRPGGPLTNDGSVLAMLTYEESMGLYLKETFFAFMEKINRIKDQTKDFLYRAKNEGKSVAGFGASITGTTLIYHFGIGEYLDYLVDDNIAKQRLFSPGHHLEVCPTSVLCTRKPDYVIILAWRFADIIIMRNQAYLEAGGQFLIPIPELNICAKKP